MNGTGAYIAAVGASTPVGRDAWSSAAAVRAGISAFGQHPYMVDSAGEPMRVALAPWLDTGLEGADRMQRLLFPAIDQVILVRNERAPEARLALRLALPHDRPGLAGDVVAVMREAVRNRYADVFAATGMFANGRAAGLMAVEAAQRKLLQDDFDACVVAGVDSYFGAETLEWLEETDQFHGAGPSNNAWGFIPGEGAGALLLVGPRMVDSFRDSLLAQVVSTGVAFEEKRIRTETICIGEGLTQAFRMALGALTPGDTISDIYCDQNGEPYRADEYGFTCLRTKEFLDSPSEFIAPADCWGDVSASTGPLCMALASIAWRKKYAKGDCALVTCGSDSGERAVVVLRMDVR